uniref:BED-type domain-containing protein n=1 Tax=Plectus sambesii TaxID=2011161 RepID=A0A914VAY2_9BILA
MTEVADNSAALDTKEVTLDDDDDDGDDGENAMMAIGAIDVDEENDSSADDDADADELDGVEENARQETDSPGETSANYESANDSGGSGSGSGGGGNGNEGNEGNGGANGAGGESPNHPPNLTYQPPIYNARNAGRKKSNPVWEFFEDLRSEGLPGVRCRFCGWSSNDRSPTTMKFHLRRKHDTGPDGPWASCAEKIALTP